MQLRNWHIGRVLIQNRVQIMFSVEVHLFFYSWPQHNFINWKYIMSFMQPLSTFFLLQLQKENLSSLTWTSHWRSCRSTTTWAHNAISFVFPTYLWFGFESRACRSWDGLSLCLSQRENLFIALLFARIHYYPQTSWQHLQDQCPWIKPCCQRLMWLLALECSYFTVVYSLMLIKKDLGAHW